MSLENESGPEDVVATVDVASATEDTSSETGADTPLLESFAAGVAPDSSKASVSSNISVEAATSDSTIAFTKQDASTKSDPSAPSTGVNVGLLVGCVAAVAAIGAALFVYKKKRQAAKEDPELDMVTPHNLSVV